jgi:hypothetical protein
MGKRLPARRGVEERNVIMVKYRFLPQYVVNKCRRGMPALHKIGLEEATSSCNLVLLRCAELWNEQGEADFKSYAVRALVSHLSRLCIEDGLIYMSHNSHKNGHRRPKVCVLDEGPGLPMGGNHAQEVCQRLDMQQALRCLNRTTRKVMHLRFLCGHRQAEVARKLSRSKTWVWQHEVAGLSALRDRLVQMGYGPEDL